tara:strand:- start:367 stop:624 length:258 start_codon:yes stop_codon:yes gene_type:complete
MSEEITEHVSYDRGYNKGFVSGLKRAFELVGQLGDFYEDGVGVSENATDEEKRLHENSRRNQVNACRYAQHVIRKNSFGEEDLPW